MLVGTFGDKKERRKVHSDEAKRLASTNQCKYFEVSSLTGENVNILFSSILTDISPTDSQTPIKSNRSRKTTKPSPSESIKLDEFNVNKKTRYGHLKKDVLYLYKSKKNIADDDVLDKIFLSGAIFDVQKKDMKVITSGGDSFKFKFKSAQLTNFWYQTFRYAVNTNKAPPIPVRKEDLDASDQSDVLKRLYGPNADQSLVYYVRDSEIRSSLALSESLVNESLLLQEQEEMSHIDLMFEDTNSEFHSQDPSSVEVHSVEEIMTIENNLDGTDKHVTQFFEGDNQMSCETASEDASTLSYDDEYLIPPSPPTRSKISLSECDMEYPFTLELDENKIGHFHYTPNKVNEIKSIIRPTDKIYELDDLSKDSQSIDTQTKKIVADSSSSSSYSLYEASHLLPEFKSYDYDDDSSEEANFVLFGRDVSHDDNMFVPSSPTIVGLKSYVPKDLENDENDKYMNQPTLKPDDFSRLSSMSVQTPIKKSKISQSTKDKSLHGSLRKGSTPDNSSPLFEKSHTRIESSPTTPTNQPLFRPDTKRKSIAAKGPEILKLRYESTRDLNRRSCIETSAEGITSSMRRYHFNTTSSNTSIESSSADEILDINSNVDDSIDQFKIYLETEIFERSSPEKDPSYEPIAPQISSFKKRKPSSLWWEVYDINENIAKLTEISSKIAGYDFCKQIKDNRIFIKEGLLYKSGEILHIFLFSDLLLMCRDIPNDKLIVKGLVLLGDNCSIVNYSNGSCILELCCHGKVMRFRTKTPMERIEWKNDIERAIDYTKIMTSTVD